MQCTEYRITYLRFTLSASGEVTGIGNAIRTGTTDRLDSTYVIEEHPGSRWYRLILTATAVIERKTRRGRVIERLTVDLPAYPPYAGLEPLHRAALEALHRWPQPDPAVSEPADFIATHTLRLLAFTAARELEVTELTAGMELPVDSAEAKQFLAGARRMVARMVARRHLPTAC